METRSADLLPSGTATVSSALIRGSSWAITSLDAALPVSDLNLMPLNRYGLWLAVTTAAPVAFRSMTVQDATCVSDGRSNITAPTPLAPRTSPTSLAKSSHCKRPPYPTPPTWFLQPQPMYPAAPSAP